MRQKISATQRTLNAWAVVLLIWSVYRYYFKTDLPVWFDEFIAKPAIFLTPIYFYVKHYEGKNFWEAVDLRLKGLKTDIWFGLFFGLIFLATGVASVFFKNGGISGFSFAGINLMMVGYQILIAFASSFSEEILSRGFVLKRLFDESRNMVTASFFASFLFFFLNVPILFTNDKIFGVTLLQIMITNIVLSLAVSFVYLQRRNVIVPIMIHGFYNLSIYLFLR